MTIGKQTTVKNPFFYNCTSPARNEGGGGGRKVGWEGEEGGGRKVGWEVEEGGGGR